MANQAQKKAQRASVSLGAKLQQWIIPINVVYILYRLLWNYSSATSWTVAGYLFLVGVTRMSYSWVVSAAEEGGHSEYAMDVLIVTLVVTAGLAFSDYFWYLYLVIPGYLLYLGSGLLLKYVFTPKESEQEDDDPASLKRKEKAERRATRPKFRMR